MNAINFIKNESKDNNDISSLNIDIQIFRQQMTTITKFSETVENKSFDIYHEIHFKLCNESRQYNRTLKESKLKDIKNISGTEWLSSYIIPKLNNIVATIYSVFYDYFYFVFIEIIKCPNCPFMYNFNVKELFYLEFDANKNRNISVFIYNYFIHNELIFIICNYSKVNRT